MHALIGAKSRYVIKRMWPIESRNLPADELQDAASAEKLFEMGGYAGKNVAIAFECSQSRL